MTPGLWHVPRRVHTPRVSFGRGLVEATIRIERAAHQVQAGGKTRLSGVCGVVGLLDRLRFQSWWRVEDPRDWSDRSAQVLGPEGRLVAAVGADGSAAAV